MTATLRGRANLNTLRRKLDDIRVGEDGALSLFVQAMERLLTAASYPDPTLVRSYLEEAKFALGDLLTASLDTLVGHSSAARGVVLEFTNQFEGEVVEPSEPFDDVGRSLSLLVSKSLRALRDFRDGPVAVARRYGVEVPNAAKLDEHIAHWQAVKANLVDCWPWSTSTELPPVAREMVAKSRAAFRAGEQAEDIDALIERLRSE